MKKSKLYWGIVLVAMLSLFACAQKNDSNNEFIVSLTDDDNSFLINRYKGVSLTTSEIPSKINNLPVTQIGDSAYQGKFIIGVTIPDSVIQIRSYAFAENQLTTVTIPDSVKQIMSYAFASNKLTNVTIPDSIAQIEKGAFAGNQLTSVTIPNSVTRIEGGAFANNRLTSVTIPDSVTQIGPRAFHLNQLTSITIGDNVTLGYQSEDGYQSAFNSSFDNFYKSNGSRAGTYNLKNWTFM